MWTCVKCQHASPDVYNLCDRCNALRPDYDLVKDKKRVRESTGNGHEKQSFAAEHMIRKTTGLVFVFLSAPVWITALVVTDANPSLNRAIWWPVLGFLLFGFMFYSKVVRAMIKGDSFREAVRDRLIWITYPKNRSRRRNPFVEK